MTKPELLASARNAIDKPRSTAMTLGSNVHETKQPTMTKQNFIALADHIRLHNRMNKGTAVEFNEDHLKVLANFLASQNPLFKRERWLWYVQDNAPKGKVRR